MGDRPFFVGIAGGTGSGKTFIARQLAAFFGEDRAVCLGEDAYYRDLSHLPARDRSLVNFDHPRALEADLMAAHLKALARGESIRKPVYDFATHTRSRTTMAVSPRPYIFVEGILILAMAPVAACLDYIIFLDVPADIRLIRRLVRDREDRGRTTQDVIRQYLDQVRPMHERFVAPCLDRADLVLSHEYLIREVAQRVRQARPGA